jgi:ABC-2 type transport system ATP-binding protein
LNAIDTRELSKEYRKFLSFKKFVAVDEVNLQVPTGSIFGFLGLNGAGKTSTIKMLLGLSYPTSGSGSVLGHPMGDIRTKEKIGFLPEEAYFQRHLTAYDFLNFCAKTLHIERAVRKDKIYEMLELVNMKGKEKMKLSEFSKGMLQRIGVAQALLNNPDLAIFDEPLTGLDPVGRSELKEIMQSLQENGKTVFFSSHILSDVQAICDHVGIMNHGRLIYQGGIDDLVNISSYKIRIEELPASHLDRIENIVDGMSKSDGQWVLEANTEEKKAEISAYLKKNNLKESNIEVSYSELEPIFIEKIKKDNEERNIS